MENKMMVKNNRFAKGSGCYTCYCCKKLTRQVDRSAAMLGLCLKCYDEGGLENEHSDYGHETFIQDCPKCRAGKTDAQA